MAAARRIRPHQGARTALRQGLAKPRRGRIPQDQRAAGRQHSLRRGEEADGTCEGRRPAGRRLPRTQGGAGVSKLITREVLLGYIEDALDDEMTAHIEQELRKSETLRN